MRTHSPARLARPVACTHGERESLGSPQAVQSSSALEKDGSVTLQLKERRRERIMRDKPKHLFFCR